MKKSQVTIYRYLNIVLLFWIYCRFSPISNQFTSSIFDNVIINYLIIIFNIFIVKYAYDNFNSKHKQLNIEMIVNIVLAIVYICSILVNYSISLYWSIVQLLVSICSYLICYFVIVKLNIQKNLTLLLIFSLLGTIIMGEVQYVKASEQCSKINKYTFANEVVYNQCKKLYDTFEEVPPYTVLDYTANSVYVRDLTSGKNEYFSFENEVEQQRFINEHTTGFDVIIPQLGTDVRFDDGENTVFYRLSFSEIDIIEKMKETSFIYFSVLMVIIIIISLVGYIYETATILP